MKDTHFPYIAFDHFVLRTPLLSFNFYKNLTAKIKVEDSDLKKAFNDVIIKEAIFLASPTLYFELEKWIKGDLEQKKEQGIKLSLLKYLSRMSSRCTPFGLFAGCTLGNFAEKTDVQIRDSKTHQRFTRPDMNYLVALSQDLAKKEHIKRQLIYFPNSSLYKSGDKLRYIEYYYVNSRRQHQIVEIDNSPYLQKILECASKGATLHQLANQLISDSISLEEAVGFLEELLESQVLTSNLEPSVSGSPFVEQMLGILETLEGCAIEIEILKEIAKRFDSLDHNLGNDPTQYLALSSFLKEKGTAFELKYLFQADIEPNSTNCSLEKEVLQGIKKALVLFNQITPVVTEDNLSRFKDAFRERYEEREMPLSKVLDVETGIGYLQNSGSGDINPLVDDIFIPASEDLFKEQNIKLNRVYAILFEKLLEAQKAKKGVIRLQEADFKDLPINWENLPDTLSSMVELVQDHKETKILISGCGGSSAANLLGRFCHKKSKLTRYTQEIIDREKAMEPHKIIAEIVHLPESRVGNILMRPNFRDYEIPYLAKSILPAKQRISLDDLYVSIKENRIFLRSKKYNKEVLPRLTNAHNYSANSLPIYHFLCDLQTQNLRGGIGFNFGPLDSMFDFLPRVEYENLIFHPARWRMQKEVIKKLVPLKADAGKLRKAIMQLQEEHALPQFVLLADGDNELLINLENSTSVGMLLETIKNREEFMFKEFLHHQNGVVFSEKGYHTNQVVVSFFNEKKMMNASQIAKEPYGTA